MFLAGAIPEAAEEAAEEAAGKSFSDGIFVKQGFCPAREKRE